MFIIDRGRIIAEDSSSELKESYGSKTAVQLKFGREVGREAVEVIERYSSRYYVDKDLAKLHIDDPHTSVPKLVGELYFQGYLF